MESWGGQGEEVGYGDGRVLSLHKLEQFESL